MPSRATVAWRVRVWDADRQASDWSDPASWSVGLLEQSDWGTARWIDYPDRAENQPLPIFARQFTVPRGKKVSDATFYLSGVGLHHATVNGRELTDEVLAPGNSNYQLSSEYRTYDLTRIVRGGANTIGVELGNGTAYVRRSVTNPAVGRTSPYSWWQSQLKGAGVLATDAGVGATTVQARQRDRLPRRRHHQRRYRWRRRPARIARHHGDRHGRRGRHRHLVHARTVRRARGRCEGDRIGQQHRRE